MIRAVEGGSACVIFPEGRITTTGSLMKVYEGPAVIAERTNAVLLPVRIEGVEHTPFSMLVGQGAPQRWFPRIRIAVLPPRRLTSPEGVTGRARRAALRRALADEMVQASFATARIDTTLFDALLEARGAPRRRAPRRRRSRSAAAELHAGWSPRATRSAPCSRRGRAPASASACCCRRRAPRWSRSSRCRPRAACRRC